MIFGQYKHAVTFALVILGAAVLVVDPGNDKDEAADHPVQSANAGLATPPEGSPPVAAPAVDDPAWYSEPGTDAADLPPAPVQGADGGYDLNPAPTPTPTLSQRAPASHAAPAPGPAPAADAYVPPPPPPQVYRPQR